MSDDKLRDDDKPLAENTETICLEIVKVLGIANFDIHSYEQSFDLLNCVAAFAMRCEEDGRSFQRLIDKTKSLEVKNGFIPDRRATADAPPEVTEEMVRNVYVASSWRNKRQPEVVGALREAGLDVYDFRNPSEGDNGFHWSEIDPAWQEWTPAMYRSYLMHPLAEVGFAKDMDALRAADAVVLVNPCGRSAHLELAWALGAGKPGVIRLSDGEPELMYKMAAAICVAIDEVRAALAAAHKEGK